MGAELRPFWQKLGELPRLVERRLPLKAAAGVAWNVRFAVSYMVCPSLWPHLFAPMSDCSSCQHNLKRFENRCGSWRWRNTRSIATEVGEPLPDACKGRESDRLQVLALHLFCPSRRNLLGYPSHFTSSCSSSVCPSSLQ